MHRGDWRAALRDAKEIFPDVPDEPLVEILKGNKTLVGRTTDPGGIDYIDDDDQEYRDHLAEMYDGATLIDGMMYRPLSVITDYVHTTKSAKHTFQMKSRRKIRQTCQTLTGPNS